MKNVGPANKSNFRFGYGWGDFISSAAAGWLAAFVLLLLVSPRKIESSFELAAFRNVRDLLFLVGVTGLLFIVFTELTALASLGRRIVSDFLLVVYTVFACLLAANLPYGFSEPAYLFALLVFLVPVVIWFTHTHREAVPDGEGETAPLLLIGGAAAILFGSAVAAIGVLRYLGYSAPNFDFGIFCQMFRNMAKTGLPVTTCERDGALSHFAVHFSPALYLLLPFYWLFPSPVTLAVGQAAILYSGVIPLILLARKKELPGVWIAFLSLAFAAYPVIGTGCFYDFHENCFLLPLLLWVFYFSESGKTVPFFVFAVLTLSVKEDAFIYLALFSVFLLVGQKKWKTAAPLLVLSLGYFAVVSFFMKKYGTGVMSWRYSNLIPTEEGLVGIVYTVFTNPGYVLTQLFSTSAGNAGKFAYLGYLLAPLGFLPVITRRASRWLLLTPLLLNLLTMYVYQFNINFQYSFGIIAFLLYAAVLNLSDLRGTAFGFGAIVYSAAAAIVAFSLLVLPMVPANLNHCRAWSDRHATITEVLDAIPGEYSVSADTFFVPHLTDRDELYETYYHTSAGLVKTDCDYYVFDLRYSLDEKAERKITRLTNAGFREALRIDGVILVLTKVPASEDPISSLDFQ